MVSEKGVVCQRAASRDFAFSGGVVSVVGLRKRPRLCKKYLISRKRLRRVMSSSGEMYTLLPVRL